MGFEDELVTSRDIYARLSDKITLKTRKEWILEVENIRRDPNSPLFSEKTFADLNL